MKIALIGDKFYVASLQVCPGFKHMKWSRNLYMRRGRRLTFLSSTMKVLIRATLLLRGALHVHVVQTIATELGHFAFIRHCLGAGMDHGSGVAFDAEIGPFALRAA